MNLPKSLMLLAGILASRCLASIILRATQYPMQNGWYDSEICRLNGIPWILLIVLSAGVAIFTIVKSKEGRVFQGIITFFVSFLLILAEGQLGIIALYCSKHNVFNRWDDLSFTYLEDFIDMHAYFSLSIIGLTCLGIMTHYLIKTNPQATELPDPEIMLLGVCVQVVFWDSISLAGVGRENFCKTGGLGSWLQLLTLSGLLAALTFFKTTESFRIARALATFLGSFLLHLIQGGTGWLALRCANREDYFYNAHEYATLVLNGYLALAMTTCFLFYTRNTNIPERSQNCTVFVAPNLLPTSHPSQSTYPAFNVNQPHQHPQAFYPQQGYYPQQAPYPQPPQAQYPPQTTYPAQASNPSKTPYLQPLSIAQNVPP